ncbi:signal transduction histidine kinase [Elusimicrobium posterum]|uniref:hypothetical protein n=1 Tax=Elusimicrobium posterum TaxID=3116653 RepID=UPI003C758891
MKKLLFITILVFAFTSAFAQKKDDLDDPKIDPKAGPIAAYLDIAYAFKNHPWTAMTKKELTGQIQAKALEIEHVKKEIELLKEESEILQDYIEKLRPFYMEMKANLDVLQPLAPDTRMQQEAFDIINNLTFQSADVRFNSPIDSYTLIQTSREELDRCLEQIKEKEFYIESQRAQTTKNVKETEDVEVNEILQDIYNELKLYCQKRNIALVVNKQDILYGQKPVDITADFVDRLTKTRKSRDRNKAKKQRLVVELDAAQQAGEKAKK